MAWASMEMDYHLASGVEVGSVGSWATADIELCPISTRRTFQGFEGLTRLGRVYLGAQCLLWWTLASEANSI